MRRYHNIDALRLAFSLTIVYYHILHANIMEFVPEDSIYQTLQRLSDNAGLVVECFFVLSGYFLFVTISRESDSFWGFTVKRIFRLGSVLWFSLVLSVAFFHQKLIPAIYNALFLQCIGISSEYRGINWYISPLFWAGLFYFALLQCVERKKANLLIAVVVYFSYVANISALNGGFGRETVFGIVNLGMARALAGVGLGYLLGVCLERFSHIRWKGARGRRLGPCINCLFFTVIELLAGVFLLKFFLLGGQYQNKFIVVIVFVGLLISFLGKYGVISRLLDRRIFSLLGRYAYSIYVMQQISFYLLQRTLWKTELVSYEGPCILISLACAAAMGIAVYHLIECPGMELYHRIKKNCEMIP